MNKKESQYIDKIIYWLVDDTEIDYDTEHITGNFLIDSNLDSIGISDGRGGFIFVSFRTKVINHCRNTYGVSDVNAEYIWSQYKQILKEKIFNHKCVYRYGSFLSNLNH